MQYTAIHTVFLIQKIQTLKKSSRYSNANYTLGVINYTANIPLGIKIINTYVINIRIILYLTPLLVKQLVSHEYVLLL